MGHVEFRIERVPLNRSEPRLLLLVERLAELGRVGWHVASVDLSRRPDDDEPITVLLEREVAAASTDGTAPMPPAPEHDRHGHPG